MEKDKTLELDDKIKLQRLGWRWQKVLWGVLALFIAGGILGVFGDGVLGNQTLGEPGSAVWLQYDRFGRKKAPMQLEFHLQSSETKPAVLQIPADYLHHFEINSITPSPNTTVTESNRVLYYFKADGPLTVLFRYKADKMGSVKGNILVNNQPFHLRHFIYP